jgi:hypothetical protein
MTPTQGGTLLARREANKGETAAEGPVASLPHGPLGERTMDFHKRILQWQVEHPNITWIGWGIVWGVVILLFVWLLFAQTPQRPGAA